MVLVFILQAVGAALAENKTLKMLNLESNYISGEGIISVLEGINTNKVVTEFRVANQVSDTIVGVNSSLF